MNTKKYTFEDLPQPDDIEICLEWSYSYDAGKYSGPYEDCYPEEEDAEVCLPDGWEGEVMREYMRAAAAAIKEIQSRVEEMNSNGTARDWAMEEAA